MSERRFWIVLLVCLAVLRLALVALHPWPWLEGEEFEHLRPIVNARAGLGWPSIDEIWKTPLGMQAGGMTLVHTGFVSLLGAVLPGWWALRIAALAYSLLAAAATISLGRQLGADRWALAVTLVCLLPVVLESQLSAYGDYWEAIALGLGWLALCARGAERELGRGSVVVLAAGAVALTWLTSALAPLALLGLAALVGQARRVWIVPGVALGFLPRLLLRGPGDSLGLPALFADGIAAWSSAAALPELRWFEGWTDPTSPLIPGADEAALAGRVVLGASLLGLALVGGLRTGRAQTALGIGLLGAAAAHVVALELSGFGVVGGPVENVSWNYRRLAFVHGLLPLGGAITLTLLSRAAGKSGLRYVLGALLALPWLVAASPGGALLASPPARAGFSDPTPLVLCHAGDGQQVALCLGDPKRPSLVALGPPWPGEPPSPNALATALRATWSVVNLDVCEFQFPPRPRRSVRAPRTRSSPGR